MTSNGWNGARDTCLTSTQRDAKFAALRGCNVNIMKQEKIMTFQMPKKHYVHQTAGGKWAVAVKHKSIFWYNPDELFDDKHDAQKQMLVEQLKTLEDLLKELVLKRLIL